MIKKIFFYIIIIFSFFNFSQAEESRWVKNGVFWEHTNSLTDIVITRDGKYFWAKDTSNLKMFLKFRMDDGTLVDSLIPIALKPLDSLHYFASFISSDDKTYCIAYGCKSSQLFSIAYFVEVRDIKTNDTLFTCKLEYGIGMDCYRVEFNYNRIDYDLSNLKLFVASFLQRYYMDTFKDNFTGEQFYGTIQVLDRKQNNHLYSFSEGPRSDQFHYDSSFSKVIFPTYSHSQLNSNNNDSYSHYWYGGNLIDLKTFEKIDLTDYKTDNFGFYNPSISPSGNTIAFGDTTNTFLKIQNYQVNNSTFLNLKNAPFDMTFLNDSIIMYPTLIVKDSIYKIIFHNINTDKLVKMITIPKSYKFKYCSLNYNFQKDILFSIGEYKTLKLNLDTIETNLTPEFYAIDTVKILNKDIQFINLSFGKPDRLLWNFGDGDTASVENPVHKYAKPGIYSVSLEIFKKDSSFKEMKENYIRILPGIKANFECDIITGIDTLNVFMKTTSTGPITNYLWKIGDSTFTKKEPSFTIYKPGFYDVTLMISDGVYSDTLVKNDYLSIIQSPLPSEYIQNHTPFSCDTSNYFPIRAVEKNSNFYLLVLKDTSKSLNIYNQPCFKYNLIKVDSNIQQKFRSQDFISVSWKDEFTFVNDSDFTFIQYDAKSYNDGQMLYNFDEKGILSNNNLFYRLNNSLYYYVSLLFDKFKNFYHFFLGHDSANLYYLVKKTDSIYALNFDINKSFRICNSPYISKIAPARYNLKQRIHTYKNSFYYFEYVAEYCTYYEYGQTYHDSAKYYRSTFTTLVTLPNGKDTLINQFIGSLKTPEKIQGISDSAVTLVTFEKNDFYNKKNKLISLFRFGNTLISTNSSMVNNFEVTYPYNDSLFLAGGSINGKATLFFLSTENLEIKKTITINSLFGNITSIERASDGEFLLLAENKINKKFDSFLAIKTKNLGKDAYPVSVDLGNEEQIGTITNTGKYIEGNSLIINYDKELSSNTILELYDLMGQKIVSTKQFKINSNTKQVICDLSQFENSIVHNELYFYILKDSNQILRGKFIR